MKLRPNIYAALLVTVPAMASALNLPAGALETATVSEPLASINIAIAGYSDGQVPVLSAEGAVTTQAWKISSTTASTLQILAPLRQQLVNDGYEVILDCADEQCGGYDFRFNISVLPEPDMHIDLGDYRYLSAVKPNGDAASDYISLLISRGGGSAFVQMTQVGSPEAQAPVIVASTMSGDPSQSGGQLLSGSLAEQLEIQGHAPLDDLEFKTASSNLGDGSFGSLAELASYLKTNPTRKIALVGHTDAQGSLAGNMALSRKRAAAVLNRLAKVYGIPRKQMEANGVGYLVPRAPNLTEEGRTKNRRVEVIITSTR